MIVCIANCSASVIKIKKVDQQQLNFCPKLFHGQTYDAYDASLIVQVKFLYTHEISNIAFKKQMH